MRKTVTIVALAATVVCLTLSAQEPPRSAGAGSLADRFGQLDKNDDGKLTREELAGRTWLLRLLEDGDKNDDGAISLEEVRSTLQRGTGRPNQEPRPPERPKQPTPAENALFEPVEIPGFNDVRGEANGLAFADLDRDGRLDIIRTGNRSRLTLLLNRGGLRFEPWTIEVRNPDGSPGQVTPRPEIPNFVDFNRDGFLDIYITTNGGRGQWASRNGVKGNQLLVSDGSPFAFVDLTDVMDVRNAEAFSRQTSIGDMNVDGWLDIAVGADNIVDGRGGLPYRRLYVFRPRGDRFEDGAFESIGDTNLVPDFGGFHGDPDKDRAGPGIVLRDLDNDGDLDLVQGYHMDTWGRIEGEYPVAFYDYGIFCWKNLLKETGEFRFERVTDNGVAQRGKLKIRAPYDYDVVEPAVALSFISTGDVDNDGLLDIVAIGSCQPSFFAGWAAGVSGQFWRNHGGFRFEEATGEAGLGSLNWTNEQWLEFFGISVTDTMRASSASRLTGPAAQGWLDFKLYGGNPVFADFNNDGWLDLHVTNRKWAFPENIFRNALYLNNGDGTFRLVRSEESGIFTNSLLAEAVDLDNDGLLDLVCARDPENNSPIVTDLSARDEANRRFRRGGTKDYPDELIHSLVLRNTGQFGGRDNHWLRLRFSGVTHANLAGARVTLHDPGKGADRDAPVLGTRIVFSSHHHKAGTPMEAHFGLAKQERVDVAVILGSGERILFPEIPANQFVELDLKNKVAQPLALSAGTAKLPASDRSLAPAAQKEKAAPESLDLPTLLAAEALQTSVVVSDLEKAQRFYAEGLGLRSFSRPRRMPDSSMMHIYRAGASAIKLRVYATPPPNRGRAVAAVNGIRFIGVPVADLTPVLDRLKSLGFPVEREGGRDGARVAVVADADGNRLELIEVGKGAARRGIEVGLVVDDLAAARSFAGDLLGLKPLPAIDSIMLPGQKEARYRLGQSVIRFLAPPGERQTFEGRPADAIGFRYITHTVRNVTAVFEAMKAHGIKLAGTGKPVRYQQNAVLMAYGPGGGIFEFVGPERENSGSGMPPALPDNRIESLFRNADQNGDGKLSSNELTQLPSLARILRFADRDQDGALSIEELRTVSARWPGREASPGGPSEAKPAPAGSDKPKDDADKAANKALNLRYHSMDFDGDGVVTQREFPNRTIFKAFDEDRSGEITRTEFVARLGSTADRGPITPESALVPIGKQVDWFHFHKDYFPGTRDPDGQLLGGTELMRLIGHDGKLFAGTSMLKDTFVVEPYPGYPGPQILRKDSSDGKWIAEKSFGRDHLRVNCMEVLTFTEDRAGNKLPTPVSLLVAGLYDIRKGEKWLTVAVRNDADASWTISRIAPLDGRDEGFAGIRSLIVHEEEVFAAADFGGIYRGAYDPAQPSRLRWVPDNEMQGGAYGRPQSMAVSDGVLYAAFGYANQRTRDKQGGLYRRVAGNEPRWEQVYSWFDGSGPFEYLMRGLTTVAGDHGQTALLGALERPPLPVVRRIEPAKDFAAVDEVNYENYFANVFGAWPNVGVFMNGAALNEFEPFTRPDNGQKAHLVTTFVIHPRSPQAGYNGAYFLVRNSQASYDWGEIKDAANLPAGVQLQGVRTIEPSPFPDERGKVFYFGGYAADYAYIRDTAWIYKGTLQKGEEYKP